MSLNSDENARGRAIVEEAADTARRAAPRAAWYLFAVTSGVTRGCVVLRGGSGQATPGRPGSLLAPAWTHSMDIILELIVLLRQYALSRCPS